MDGCWHNAKGSWIQVKEANLLIEMMPIHAYAINYLFESVT